MENSKIFRLSDRFLKNEEFSERRNVVKAYDTATCEQALLKRWKNSDGGGINEIKIRSSVSHKNITEFLCSFEENDYRYMACRWANGISLKEYVSEYGTLGEHDALIIFSEICSTADYLIHSENGPLVHGDIKPENIVLDLDAKENEKFFRVYLVDFETCTRIAEPDKRSVEHSATLPVGSYFFSAPETLMGRKTTNSDIYSAGAVLGFMLYGNDFIEDTEHCIKREVKVGKLLRDCLIRDEKLRVITAEGARKRAEAILSGNYTGKEKKKTKTDYTEKKKQGDETRGVESLRVAEKLSVCIDNNLCFATELAYACGELFGLKTLLVDSFTSKNRVSSYMLGDRVSEEESGFYGIAGISESLKTKPETWYERGLIGIADENDRLYIGTQTLCEELFSEETNLGDFYSWAYRNFDAVIINVYKNTDERLKNELFKLSNSVIIAEEPNVDQIESLFAYYRNRKTGGIEYGNNLKYVAWDYRNGRSLPTEGIRCLVGMDNFLGTVSFDETRYKMRNTMEKPEFYGKSEETKKEYGEILSKLLFGGEK